MIQISTSPIPVGKGMSVRGVGKLSVLRTGPAGDFILFYANQPIGAITGGMAYLGPTVLRGVQAAVNKEFALYPQVRSPQIQLDFIIGQILTKAGLGLVRAEGQA